MLSYEWLYSNHIPIYDFTPENNGNGYHGMAQLLFQLSDEFFQLITNQSRHRLEKVLQIIEEILRTIQLPSYEPS